MKRANDEQKGSNFEKSILRVHSAFLFAKKIYYFARISFLSSIFKLEEPTSIEQTETSCKKKSNYSFGLLEEVFEGTDKILLEYPARDITELIKHALREQAENFDKNKWLRDV